MGSFLSISVSLRTLATIWVGLMSGFVFAFSVVVMPGLAITDPGVAMEAMQSINAVVRNVAFAIGFFGALVFCGAAMVYTVVRRESIADWLSLAGGAVYVIGGFGITFVVNVPMNEALAELDPSVQANHPEMLTYLREWSMWNHLRTASSVVAFLLLVCSLIMQGSTQLARATGSRPSA